MSLCHVSSFWRMVALDCPALWSHLRLHMRVTMQYAEWAVHKGDIEFIQWWRTNQGARLPYLLIRMSFRSKIDNPNVYDVDGMNFVMEYLITAQYIHVRDTLFWSLLAHWTRSQSRPLFSNLHTLAGSNGFFNFGKFYNSQMFIGYASGAAPSSLRRLCMTYYTLERELIPTYWSMLTDISLHHTRASRKSRAMRAWSQTVPDDATLDSVNE
ncbi:hypothetical protein BDN70DRAFT_932744 [Pholiota conissans]|uniref:F-box domain-containing protein n=1 Tax=Pholiota conissans TaxID=109636 RepID=A0A9P5Z126_9AGAR|nr:hypothetical protein BDN70DRAFT_932744 [Pholiota conissans]